MLPTIATGNVGSALAGEFEVANSLRFDDGSSDYLSKTFASAGNRKTWTWSGWVKRATLSTNYILFSAGTSSSHLRIYDDDKIGIGISGTGNFKSSGVIRDTSGWYHIVYKVDTTLASNRVTLYINGSVFFQTDAGYSLNADTTFNNNIQHYVGHDTEESSWFFDGYLAEVCFIDGQALDPTSFGEFDEDTGIWKPIDVSGLTFGTNGFYLDFENSGSLGADVSGNGNNFTVNNLTSIDQSTDTCTNNFCTLQTLRPGVEGTLTLSDGNLSATKTGTGTWFASYGSMGVSQGKWYYEIKFTSATGITEWVVGWGATEIFSYANETRNIVGYTTGSDGEVYTGKTSTGSTSANYGSFSNGDIMGIALNLDDEQISIYKNGTALVTDFDYTTVGTVPYDTNGYVTPKVAHKNTGSVSVNFGNPPYSISSGNSDGNGYGNFEYSVPSGYYALNTKNLAEYG